MHYLLSLNVFVFYFELHFNMKYIELFKKKKYFLKYYFKNMYLN